MNVVVVGQIPPPFHGQAVMIENLLSAEYSDVALHHIPMRFSQQISDVGNFQFVKLWHLVVVIAKIVWVRITRNASILYYPPAGPEKVPMYRDFAILLATRWLFRRVIFHFHAGGVSQLYAELSRWERVLFRKAYYFADVGVRLASGVPDDPGALKALHSVIVPYGVPDHIGQYHRRPRDTAVLTVLFVGALQKSKGVLVLLAACSELVRQGLRFRVDVVGDFRGAAFEKEARRFVRQNDLASVVTWHGVLEGSNKWKVYADADIFCFPSFYEAEALPVVLIEAMSFGLPVVATSWRGIPDLVQHGVNGFLVPVDGSEKLANQLRLLLQDSELRARMGKESRKLYEENFSQAAYRNNIQSVFELVRTSAAPPHHK